MFPGLDFSEIALVGILALLVLGPKDLPLLLRKLGRFTARLRSMANEFRAGFDELARQAELEELRKEVNALRQETAVHEQLLRPGSQPRAIEPAALAEAPPTAPPEQTTDEPAPDPTPEGAQAAPVRS